MSTWPSVVNPSEWYATDMLPEIMAWIVRASNYKHERAYCKRNCFRQPGQAEQMYLAWRPMPSTDPHKFHCDTMIRLRTPQSPQISLLTWTMYNIIVFICTNFLRTQYSFINDCAKNWYAFRMCHVNCAVHLLWMAILHSSSRPQCSFSAVRKITQWFHKINFRVLVITCARACRPASMAVARECIKAH